MKLLPFDSLLDAAFFLAQFACLMAAAMTFYTWAAGTPFLLKLLVSVLMASTPFLLACTIGAVLWFLDRQHSDTP